MAANQGNTSKLLPVILRSDKAFTGLLVLAFLFFGFIGIVNHEMWLDEVQAWLIARDSSSFVELFKNLRYEGHPGLWHIGLYLISRFTHEPFFMQLFHLIIASSSIYIFAKFAPFTKFQKVLFSFGYFPFYEYSIISRNYAIEVLFIFGFCALFKTRNKSYFWITCILFLLANTNVYGLLIAIALGLTLIFECILDKRRFANVRKWDLIISFFIIIFGIVSSIFQILPPSDASFAAGWTTDFQIGRFARVLLTIGKSYVPIPNFFTYKFWNISIFEVGIIASVLGLVFSLGLLTFALILFARKPVVFFLYLTGNLGILLFTYTKIIGGMRHWGHLFILFITCLWISSYYTKSDLFMDSVKSLFPIFFTATRNLTNFSLRYKNKVIMAILYTHLVAGIFAFTMDLYNPFSVTKEVAKFIKNQRMDDIVIVGDIDYINYVGPSLSTYLDKKIYYLGSQTSGFGSFIVWDNKRVWDDKREHARRQQVSKFFEKIGEFITVKETNILLVFNHKLDTCKPEKEDRAIEGGQLKFESYCLGLKNLYFSKVSEFTKSIIPDENPGLYLYLVRHKQKS